jgi:hypothetical protein
MNDLSDLKFDNLDIDLEDFRHNGYKVIDAITKYYSTIKDRKIISESSSKEIEKVFDEALPLGGTDT